MSQSSIQTTYNIGTSEPKKYSFTELDSYEPHRNDQKNVTCFYQLVHIDDIPESLLPDKVKKDILGVFTDRDIYFTDKISFAAQAIVIGTLAYKGTPEIEAHLASIGQSSDVDEIFYKGMLTILHLMQETINSQISGSYFVKVSSLRNISQEEFDNNTTTRHIIEDIIRTYIVTLSKCNKLLIYSKKDIPWSSLDQPIETVNGDREPFINLLKSCDESVNTMNGFRNYSECMDAICSLFDHEEYIQVNSFRADIKMISKYVKSFISFALLAVARCPISSVPIIVKNISFYLPLYVPFTIDVFQDRSLLSTLIIALLDIPLVHFITSVDPADKSKIIFQSISFDVTNSFVTDVDGLSEIRIDEMVNISGLDGDRELTHKISDQWEILYPICYRPNHVYEADQFVNKIFGRCGPIEGSKRQITQKITRYYQDNIRNGIKFTRDHLFPTLRNINTRYFVVYLQQHNSFKFVTPTVFGIFATIPHCLITDSLTLSTDGGKVRETIRSNMGTTCGIIQTSDIDSRPELYDCYNSDVDLLFSTVSAFREYQTLYSVVIGSGCSPLIPAFRNFLHNVYTTLPNVYGSTDAEEYQPLSISAQKSRLLVFNVPIPDESRESGHLMGTIQILSNSSNSSSSRIRTQDANTYYYMNVEWPSFVDHMGYFSIITACPEGISTPIDNLPDPRSFTLLPINYARYTSPMTLGRKYKRTFSAILHDLVIFMRRTMLMTSSLPPTTKKDTSHIYNMSMRVHDDHIEIASKLMSADIYFYKRTPDIEYYTTMNISITEYINRTGYVSSLWNRCITESAYPPVFGVLNEDPEYQGFINEEPILPEREIHRDPLTDPVYGTPYINRPSHTIVYVQAPREEPVPDVQQMTELSLRLGDIPPLIQDIQDREDHIQQHAPVIRSDDQNVHDSALVNHIKYIIKTINGPINDKGIPNVLSDFAKYILTLTERNDILKVYTAALVMMQIYCEDVYVGTYDCNIYNILSLITDRVDVDVIVNVLFTCIEGMTFIDVFDRICNTSLIDLYNGKSIKDIIYNWLVYLSNQPAPTSFINNIDISNTDIPIIKVHTLCCPMGQVANIISAIDACDVKLANGQTITLEPLKTTDILEREIMLFISHAMEADKVELDEVSDIVAHYRDIITKKYSFIDTNIINGIFDRWLSA
jgi:hypothetical protein